MASENHGQLPQEDGQLGPPSRRPPTAVAVATPEPPGGSGAVGLLKRLVRLVMSKLRTGK